MLLTERYKLTMPSKSIITSENCSHFISVEITNYLKSIKMELKALCWSIQTSTKQHTDVVEKL